ncbi:MAG: M15 family metallopeptidase [Clostridiales bacterium]|nr:M15 family metallopeptidase [Clostridiales bacterium]
MGISAFRSYDRQKELYENSVREHGREYAYSHVAMPGTSEHQTGLAIDVSCPGVDYDLCEEFEKTPEGIWLKKNASYFGFTFSFTNENSSFTGYVSEPWHIRYVCKDATYYDL